MTGTWPGHGFTASSAESNTGDERWQKIERIFHAARELQGGARAEFLTRACADDPSLHNAVEALLDQHQEAGSFLEAHPSGDLRLAKIVRR